MSVSVSVSGIGVVIGERFSGKGGVLSGSRRVPVSYMPLGLDNSCINA